MSLHWWPIDHLTDPSLSKAFHSNDRPGKVGIAVDRRGHGYEKSTGHGETRTAMATETRKSWSEENRPMKKTTTAPSGSASTIGAGRHAGSRTTSAPVPGEGSQEAGALSHRKRPTTQTTVVTRSGKGLWTRTVAARRNLAATMAQPSTATGARWGAPLGGSKMKHPRNRESGPGARPAPKLGGKRRQGQRTGPRLRLCRRWGAAWLQRQKLLCPLGRVLDARFGDLHRRRRLGSDDDLRLRRIDGDRLFGNGHAVCGTRPGGGSICRTAGGLHGVPYGLGGSIVNRTS